MKIKYLATALMGVVILASCKGEPETAEMKRPEITGVRVGTVNTTSVDEYYEASGTVRAATISVVSARIMGAVTSVTVSEGDRVRRGQTLLTIDDRDLKEKARAAEEAYNAALRALETARSQKELAEKAYERYKRLHEERALTDHEFDEVETRRNVAASELERMEAMVRQAEAGRREAKVFLGFSRVISPIDGVVSEKKIDPGSMASPGMPLLVVEDTSSYTIDINVDERFLERITKGMGVDVSIASLDGDIQGRVAEVVPSVNPASRTFLVKVSVLDLALRNGMYGKVHFATGTKEKLLVPVEAVVSKGQLTGVYAVDEQRNVAYRLIRTGKSYPEGIEVLSGLDPGDKIIVEGVEKAADGGVLKEAAQ